MACLKRFVYFEIGALFHSLHRRVRKRANFKTNKFLQAIQSSFTVVNNRESLRKVAWVCEWYGLKAHNF